MPDQLHEDANRITEAANAILAAAAADADRDRHARRRQVTIASLTLPLLLAVLVGVVVLINRSYDAARSREAARAAAEQAAEVSRRTALASCGLYVVLLNQGQAREDIPLEQREAYDRFYAELAEAVRLLNCPQSTPAGG